MYCRIRPREGKLDKGIFAYVCTSIRNSHRTTGSEYTHLPSAYAASTGANSIGPLFTSPGTPVTGGTSEISEAAVVIEELAPMESIVGKDELATIGSIDAIEEALRFESPGVLGRLFAAESVSHMVIRMPS